MKNLLIGTGTVIAAAAILIIFGFLSATRLPENRPENFIKQRPTGEYKTVVCVGDSITHGAVSFNYVDELSSRMSDNGYFFVNAGINSELAWNVLQRIDNIIACKPDYITILIGTNDANGTLTDKIAQRQVKEMGLPRKSSKDWFRKNLLELCSMLKAKTGAKIALLSIPPIGEDSEDIAFRRAAEFSKVIRDVARLQRLAYIPLNETMTTFLRNKKGSKPSVSYDSLTPLMYKSIFKRKILRKSYNDISADSGFLLVTDFLHLNSNAGNMVADRIEGFIREK